MFRAISHQLIKSESAHKRIRAIICDYIQFHHHRYAPFLVTDVHPDVNTFGKYDYTLEPIQNCKDIVVCKLRRNQYKIVKILWSVS